MDTEGSVTKNCVHCGGEIRSAAKICKHCKRPVEAAVESTSRVSEAPTTTVGADVTRDLRALLVSRGLLSSAAFDALAAQHPGADAATTLGHLRDAGHITALQVEFHREAFHERQLARLNALLDGAVARAMLGATHAQAARSGFESVVYQQTPAQYLIAAQYLTAAQIRALGDGALQPIVAQTPGRASTIVATGRWDVGAWWRSLAPEVRQAAVGISLLVALVGALLAARGSPDIVSQPVMNGRGDGTATFTNRGALAGSVCGHVTVSCGRGSRRSATFCSGTVEPNATKRVEFTVAEMDVIIPYGRDWRHDCDLGFVHETTGN